VGTNGPYRFVRNVLKYEPELERAVQFAAGSAVLCDTLADAKRLRFDRNARSDDRLLRVVVALGGASA
jgi:chromosome segregation ATPase